jgi:hypothetical protein
MRKHTLLRRQLRQAWRYDLTDQGDPTTILNYLEVAHIERQLPFPTYIRICVTDLLPIILKAFIGSAFRRQVRRNIDN